MTTDSDLPRARSASPGSLACAATTAPVLEVDAAEETDGEQIIDDGDSALGSLNSATTSLKDEFVLQRREHGREYKGFMEAKYVLPMDEQELERLDLQCHLVWLSLDKKQFFAPVQDMRSVLDVGCGTGMWAIDFADANPDIEVLGVDLAPVQPEFVPPNLSFEVDDLEAPWNFTQKFQFIHSQLMIGAFQDWPKFFKQSFEYLDTDGYLEIHDIDFVIKCDDGTLSETSALHKWHTSMHDAAAKAGFPLDAIANVPDMMRAAGYVDVVATPIKWPINTWPKDAKHKEIGRWALENFSMGCESMSLALFSRVLGWSVEEIQVFMAQVRGDLRNRKIHAYWNFWAVHGRKPAL